MTFNHPFRQLSPQYFGFLCNNLPQGKILSCALISTETIQAILSQSHYCIYYIRQYPRFKNIHNPFRTHGSKRNLIAPTEKRQPSPKGKSVYNWGDHVFKKTHADVQRVTCVGSQHINRFVRRYFYTNVSRETFIASAPDSDACNKDSFETGSNGYPTGVRIHRVLSVSQHKPKESTLRQRHHFARNTFTRNTFCQQYFPMKQY